MASISDEDMATLQKLSNDYEPEVEVAVMHCLPTDSHSRR